MSTAVPVGAVDEAISALEAHVALTRDLVEISQREQAHLLAFEIPQLTSSTDEKRVLLSQLQANEARLSQHLAAAGEQHGVAQATVSALAAVIDASAGERMLELASCVRSLTASLHELQSVTLVHADRGGRFVRAYASLLRGVDSSLPAAPGTETYDSGGKRRPATIPGGTLARRA